jgi:hypothetical protein
MRTIFRVTGLVTLLAAVVLFPTAAAGVDGVDAQTAFDQLKTLAGTWHGTPEGQGEAAAEEAEHKGEVVHEFRVSAAGTVVMETMMPGTDDEMINMYHLDGDDLLVTHYCSGGNQPRMRLDRDRSTARTLVFDFAGGTNLDPAVDGHIHAAKITFVDDEHLDSAWTSHAEGKQAGVMTFHLARAE